MKVVVLLLILSVALTACGPESSPEGRMTLKLNELKQQVDSLKTQNAEIKDSLAKINITLKAQKK
ncbi:hypothetical protein ACFQZS_16160 [Mucilaginibacter calamicampi]|uniref:Uncharacterized protein n=1 Tax=Mucilaginibacter calamicampi TaxID=1302352 RepID=A0ABW2Z054_9SPHI